MAVIGRRIKCRQRDGRGFQGQLGESYQTSFGPLHLHRLSLTQTNRLQVFIITVTTTRRRAHVDRLGVAMRVWVGFFFLSFVLHVDTNVPFAAKL